MLEKSNVLEVGIYSMSCVMYLNTYVYPIVSSLDLHSKHIILPR
jgi:hypothetical protein